MKAEPAGLVNGLDVGHEEEKNEEDSSFWLDYWMNSDAVYLIGQSGGVVGEEAILEFYFVC